MDGQTKMFCKTTFKTDSSQIHVNFDYLVIDMNEDDSSL